MKRIMIMFVSVFLAVVLAACGGNKVDDVTAEKYSAKAEDVILLLNEGNYEAVFEQFDDVMQEGLPVVAMGELTPIIKESGEFEGIDKASVEEKDGIFTTVSRAKYSDKNRIYTISFNEADEIAGLFIK